MNNNLLRKSYLKLTLWFVLCFTTYCSLASVKSMDCDLICNKKIISNKFKSDAPTPSLKDFSNILALSEDELNYHIVKWAIFTNNASLVDELFKFGVPVNLTSSHMETTFLMHAARQAHPDIIQIILDHGGLPNLLDADGSTAIENIYFSTSMKINERLRKGKKVSDKFLLRRKNIPLVIKQLLPVTTVLEPQLATYISSYAEDYTDEKSLLIEDYIACKEDEELFLPYEGIEKLVGLKTEQVKNKAAIINSITSQFKNTISEKIINKVNLNHENFLTALSNIKAVSKNDKVKFYAYVYQLDDAWYDFNSSFSSLERVVVKEVTAQLNNIKKIDSLTSSQLDEKFNKILSFAITQKTMQQVIEFYAERKEWSKADLVLNKYIQFLKTNNILESGSLFKKLSWAYQSNKNYEDQIVVENKRLNLIISIEGDSSENIAPSYENIGYAKYRIEKYDEAIESYKKAISLTTKPEKKAFIYRQMGWVYGAKKSYLERVGVEQKRIDVITELEGEDSMKLASSYENIAYAKYQLDDDTSAIHFYEKALKLRTKPEDKAKIFKQLGWAYKSNNSYDKLMDVLVKRYEMLLEASNKMSDDDLDSFYNDFLDALPKVEIASQKKYFRRILRLTKSQSERIKLYTKSEYKILWTKNPESYVFIAELYLSELTDKKLSQKKSLKDLDLLSLGNAYAKLGNEKLALKYLALNYEYAENKNSERFIIYSKYTESISERTECIEAIKPNSALLDSNDDDIELERCMKLGWKNVYGTLIEQLKLDSKEYKEKFSINRRIRNLAITQHNLMFRILNRKYDSVRASLNSINDNNLAKASHSQLVEVEKKLENYVSYVAKFRTWVSDSVLKEDENIKKTIDDSLQSHWTLKMFIYDFNKLKEEY
ncbi:tetratricopeptide repeat protein [Glaciecola sp. MF2-115]|uniref:tetratricopeptide repeat protein n=1 Tax=Glaciecola sp. MF2-115 TaxID=3384827 RepID=UPI0039A39A0A